MTKHQLMKDGYRNVVAGLDPSKDKSAAGHYVDRLFSQNQLIAAYNSSWIARRVVDIPAKDATRRWRSWTADKEEISLLEKEEKRLRTLINVRDTMQLGRLLGAGALYMSVEDAESVGHDQPIDFARLGKGCLRRLSVISRNRLTPGEIEQDVDSEYYGFPSVYKLTTPGGQVDIHPSRLAIFYGNRHQDENDNLLFSSANVDNWHADSILEPIFEAILQADSAMGSAASMLFESKVDVYKLPQLMALLESDPNYAETVAERFRLANRLKGINNALVLDAEEEYDTKQLSFGGVSELIDRFFRWLCGAVDIPATRFFGDSPSGLNSNGDSEIRLYYDNVSSVQSNDMGPSMTNLDRLTVISALGKDDDAIYASWRPLWAPNETEKLDNGKKIIDIGKGLTDIGVDKEIVAEATTNALIENEVMPGLEAAIDDFDGELIAEEDPVDVTAAAPPVRVPQGQKPALKVVGDQSLQDAKPMSLYVYRSVVNAAEILAHYEAQGAEDLMPAEELHVTIMYSEAQVDWMKMSTSWAEKLELPAGGPRLHEVFGNNAPFAQVLLFKGGELHWRHRDLREEGAVPSHEEYHPHITLSYGDDMEGYEPWTGPIVLGPEMWEEVNSDWKSELLASDEFQMFLADAASAQKRWPAGSSKGGQFAPKGIGGGGAGGPAGSKAAKKAGGPAGGAAGGPAAGEAGHVAKKDAVDTTYYMLKKAGGYSWLTQKNAKDLVEGKTKPKNELQQKVVDTYKQMNSLSSSALANYKKKHGDAFSKAIAEQKAKAAAKKAAAMAKAKGLTVVEGGKGKVAKEAASKVKAVESAEAKVKAVKAKIAKAKAAETPEQKAKIEEAYKSVAKSAYGMQVDTLKKLESGEWKPDPSKPWQKKALEQLATAKHNIKNPPPAPKPGTLTISTPSPSFSSTKNSEVTELLKSRTKSGPADPQSKVATKQGEYSDLSAKYMTSYTGSSYSSINQNLRSGKPPTKLDLSRDRFIAAHKAVDDHVVLRGISPEGVKNVIKSAGGILKPGQVITDLGYMSTTRNVGTARSFSGHGSGGYVMQIKVKKGQSIAPVKNISHHPSEDEFVLPRSTRMKIVNIDTDNRILELEVEDG